MCTVEVSPPVCAGGSIGHFDPPTHAGGNDLVEQATPPCCLLRRHVARDANTEFLTLIQMNVFAAFAQDTGRSDSGANGRAHRSADSATCNGADDRTDAGRAADFFHVAFGRIPSLHAAFRIDLSHALAATVRNDFNDLGAHLCRAAISESDFVKCQLQLRVALHPPRTFHTYDPAIDSSAFILFRLEHARLKTIAFL